MRIRPTFLILCWAVLILVWFVAAFSAKPVKQRQDRRSRAITILSLALAFALLAGRIDFDGLGRRILVGSAQLHFVANGLVLLGLVICLWARVSLGTNWSGAITLKENHELIEKGPYRFVRHPMYTGLLVMFLGTALAAGRVSAFLGLVICLFALWHKLRLEETLLLANFPDTYPSYKARTKALVPFLV